ncbi:EamA family transporter RarD [Millisia brevis]|uniref:EamA family transporter RarD n=1 Tax=Millisia brevis TaxID=264148 RepID=UPI000A0008EA|nr:EamA family transporter RarD [Millisia brevis]
MSSPGESPSSGGPAPGSDASPAASAERSTFGYVAGVTAYGLWGLFPAYFGLVSAASTGEILANRVIWAAVTMLVVLAVVGRLGDLRRFDRRTWVLVITASILIGINWFFYLYAVLSGNIVQAALGYFINPLVSVAMGLIFFGERLSRWQKAAVAIGVLAVGVLTVDYGHPPYLSLLLAGSFAAYGAVKKIVRADPRVTLTAESLVLSPLMIGIVIWLIATGGLVFGSGLSITVLLLLAGPVTAVPLLMFGIAAQRIPLVALGLLQYLTPIGQFAWAVLVAGETVSGVEWIGFGLIWFALSIFTIGAIRSTRAPRPAEPA